MMTHLRSLRNINTKRFSTTQIRSFANEPPKVEYDDKQVKVNWESGRTSSFHNIWLRDHCRSPHSFHSITKQRLVNTSLIPSNIKPINIESTPSGLSIKWNDGTEQPSSYPWKWLYQSSYNPKLVDDTQLRKNEKVLWDSRIANNPPTIPYEFVMNDDKGVLNWLSKIEKYGIGFVDGVTPTAEATEELTSRIAFIRETHYGKFWDFTADLKHGDTAYTDIALGAHTDTTYFTDPIGLQLFHLLQPATSGGGESLFVDGFYCAQQLKEKDINAFNTLVNTPIPAHSVGSPEAIMLPSQRSGYPIINLDNLTQDLLQIRYNNDDRSVMTNLQPEMIEEFYRSLKLWSEIITDSANEYWTPLSAGRVVLFDNWRVLHGRASFKGKRRLCGAYINHDDYASRLLTLKEKFLDENLRNTHGTLF
ncbi:Trimethyllysine dioxygenase [Wallemia mellicola CBS 633.66]|uniref:trimethyllysine dioxygenase n=2 Tax=Wallemia mellicola TaxID=1708541 RepID=I4YJ24_WALMC|nr:Trimethyllysine dioxygenase [Wallemia mellicola CBS 633.66]EIM23966.1 Trimethyllysine dioxygenase [Wallemia mellicola CBS 633.66]|eukprot:XP_006955803.1 Trimethyllysine dioxygenase [Wallemia mellicola CBS 633.66]